MPGEQHRFFVIRAWMVHFYTSLGLVCALIAIASIATGNMKPALVILSLAMLIDATDGALARAWEVKKYTPQFDGRKLDDITDYINYAFIPLYAAYRFGMVEGAGTVVLGVAAIAAAYGFCQSGAKTQNDTYTGFPNFWNIIIFYMYLFHFSPVVNEILILIFSILIWAPIEFVSLSTRPLHKLTIAVDVMYALVISGVIYLYWTDQSYTTLIWISLFGPLYYIISAFYLRGKSGKDQGLQTQ
jgi:phosphatidylcholine synthase